jgi:hypothetical protein
MGDFIMLSDACFPLPPEFVLHRLGNERYLGDVFNPEEA